MFLLPLAVLSIPTIVYFLAAVLPALFLMRYIYRSDTIEKEPDYILWGLVKRGCLAGLIAMALETAGMRILDSVMSADDPDYVFWLAFGVVAMAEEGAKLFLLKKYTWNAREFNYRFDGIVYAAFISLGFAAFENVGYVFSYGLSVALSRAVFAIPGHLGFSVYMGIFYALSRQEANRGNTPAAGILLAASYAVPVFLHGFYDSCCMRGTPGSSAVFTVFVILMYIIVTRTVRKYSVNDRPV